MDSEDFFLNPNFTNVLLSFTNRYKNYNYSNFSAELNDLSKISLRDSIIIACYSTIVIVSIFGNLLVCNIVVRRASMRKTTYIFIANLALSDLLMTVLNIPFNVARVLLNDWPFGGFMCSMVPLVQVTSVYVSTFTMVIIALDRYRVICRPLMPRLDPTQAVKAIILVWLVSLILSIPHAVYNRITTVFTYRYLVRCRSIYPKSIAPFITPVTFATQYFLPLSITGVVYSFIIAKVWSRDALGVVTEAQLVKQAKAKRKTIKMLVLVVILFAICWLPLNVYHLLKEFTTVEFVKSSTIYFLCHWLAMSSICYNPFIYCWLNNNFRSGAIACFFCIRNVGQKLKTSISSDKQCKNESFKNELDSQSFGDSKTSCVLPLEKDFCEVKTERETKERKKSKTCVASPNRKISKDSFPMASFDVTESSSNSNSKFMEQSNVSRLVLDAETSLN